MQFKSQDDAMQAKLLDGKGKSHSPESASYGSSTYGARPMPVVQDLEAAEAALSDRVAAAQRSVQEMSDKVVARARKTAAAANDYVHKQPWKVIGAGAAVGLVLGLLFARRR